MAEKIAEKSSIAIETVLDWAYCEAKVWWKTVGRTIEEEAEKMISPRTGTSLLQEAIQGILKLGYQSFQNLAQSLPQIFYNVFSHTRWNY